MAHSRAQVNRSCTHVHNILFFFCLILIAAEAKPKKYGGSSKVYWKKENECAKGECHMFHPDENDDCVAKCVSAPCYEEVYASDPLEPGEIDRPRQNRFNTCVRTETSKEAQRKAEEKKANKN
mmetsp:Transcript_100697/g.157261  ORF Transcript_100697/g.157261 Transcript_100697/m.157261 type:complete len:123 (-) Transcript_100697:2-370(-)